MFLSPEFWASDSGVDDPTEAIHQRLFEELDLLANQQRTATPPLGHTDINIHLCMSEDDDATVSGTSYYLDDPVVTATPSPKRRRREVDVAPPPPPHTFEDSSGNEADRSGSPDSAGTSAAAGPASCQRPDTRRRVTDRNDRKDIFRFLERMGHLLTGAPERSAKTPGSLESLAELTTTLREHGGPVYDQLRYDPKLRELMATVTVNGVFERLCAKRDSTKHTQATTKAAAAIIARFFTDLFPDDAVA
jgi:hypothetical protein